VLISFVNKFVFFSLVSLVAPVDLHVYLAEISVINGLNAIAITFKEFFAKGNIDMDFSSVVRGIRPVHTEHLEAVMTD